ncbi:MAG: NifU family protein [Nitrospinae bacterium]|nr:NifU family protein [Nitrospinota bacterium]
MEEEIKAALEKVRPGLQMDGGDVDFVGVDENGVVQVKLRGACGSCPSAMMTLKFGIETRLKEEVPGVTEVVAV